MNIKKLVSSTIALGLLTLTVGASASDTVFHGSLCNPEFPSDVSKLEYGQFGIDNSSASTAFVSCGAGTAILATINTVEIETYDRNPSTDVSCTLVLTDVFGQALFSQTKSTTSFGPSPKLLSYNPGVGTHTVNIDCSLPANSGGNVSHVTTYRIITP